LEVSAKVKSVTESAKYMEVQRIQSEYRRRLVRDWRIESGSTILELGCGQGDMTAALAEATGPEGLVTATDIASREYGAPLTLGEATDILKATPFGRQIEFLFEFDILNAESRIGERTFETAVMAHSSWYFGSFEQLRSSLSVLGSRAQRLCFAEWDLEPKSIEQVPHLLAILIQSQVESFKRQSSANVRTPLPRAKLIKLLGETGWQVTSVTDADTHDLQDARWEIDACLQSSAEEARVLDLPPKFIEQIASQIELLRTVEASHSIRPLGAYSLVAENSLNLAKG